MISLQIEPFMLGIDKEAALKPLEEAAEVFGAWQWFDRDNAERMRESYIRLSDELADCIQACVNLAYRYGVDLGAAMERCEQRNRERGRYDAR